MSAAPHEPPAIETHSIGRGLPCPGVRLGADYRARLERFTPRISAALDRREGAGTSSLTGAGPEFVGHRPYRSGDDPRTIDWNLLARLDRPYVRLAHREAREHWVVLLDGSASMGVGPPGKLQRAAEVVGALALLGLKRGAEVEILVPGGGEIAFHRHGPGALARLGAWLEGLRASGGAGADELRPRARACSRASRVFLVGDPFACLPRELFALAPRLRAWHVLHLVAPLELEPPTEDAIEWRDAESDRTLALALDDGARTEYVRELERALGAWREAARARGARHGAWSTALGFEDVLRAALGA